LTVARGHLATDVELSVIRALQLDLEMSENAMDELNT
jgi:hypothetical protein